MILCFRPSLPCLRWFPSLLWIVEVFVVTLRSGLVLRLRWGLLQHCRLRLPFPLLSCVVAIKRRTFLILLLVLRWFRFPILPRVTLLLLLVLLRRVFANESCPLPVPLGDWLSLQLQWSAWVKILGWWICSGRGVALSSRIF